jgi:hypothetical protein
MYLACSGATDRQTGRWIGRKEVEVSATRLSMYLDAKSQNSALMTTPALSGTRDKKPPRFMFMNGLERPTTPFNN